MDNLIVWIAVIWGALWLLGVVLRVLSDFANAVREQWERTRPGRERVGYAIGHPMGMLTATIIDHRLMSAGLAFVLFVAALFLAGADSASLVSSLDAIGGKDAPLVGWAIFGGVAGVAMGIGARVLEFGWLGAAAISRVPDIGHLRAGEEVAARYFRIRRVAAAVGAVILLAALAFSYSRNAGYDPRANIDRLTAAIGAAGTQGNISILNGALDDSAGRLQSDPKTGLKILVALQGLSKDGARPEVDRVAKVAQKYLAVFREETEKLVTDGKPEAFARSEAFAEVDRVASLKWLGRLYEVGKGGANRDLSKAFSFYGEAASAGDKTAATMQDKVVHMMVSAKEEGVRQEAFKYLGPRAQAGAPSDHYWFGEWYARSGKPEDVKNAEKWLGKALAQDADAQVKNMAFASLSRLKDVGAASIRALDEEAPKYAKGNDENLKGAAYAYLEQRANAGDPGATLWMGFRYTEGDGVPKDEEKARDWFLKAAFQEKNLAVKDQAFEALGERTHPPIPGTEVVPLSKDHGSFANSDAGRGPAVEPKTYQPVRPVEPLPASAARERPYSIPLNASLNVYGQGWTCNRGYRQAGSECAPVQIPLNAGLDVYGHGWTCNRGYRQAGNECVPVQIPANAGLDVYGHGWTCNRGYRQAGNECVPVQIPANAGLNVYGNGWVCNNGYRQLGTECVPGRVTTQ